MATTFKIYGTVLGGIRIEESFEVNEKSEAKRCFGRLKRLVESTDHLALTFKVYDCITEGRNAGCYIPRDHGVLEEASGPARHPQTMHPFYYPRD